MPELEQLHAGHAAAVLAFELVNRAYFAASISDRGDEFFDQFPDRHSALLAEQEAGICAFYVLVADDGSVLGRFKLPDSAIGLARPPRPPRPPRPISAVSQAPGTSATSSHRP